MSCIRNVSIYKFQKITSIFNRFFALEKNKTRSAGRSFAPSIYIVLQSYARSISRFFLASNFVTELSRSSKSKGVVYNILCKHFWISLFNSFCPFYTSSKPFPAAPPLSAPDKGLRAPEGQDHPSF